MTIRTRVRDITLRTLAAVSVACLGACTLESGEAPPLTGPSEYGLSITLTASPDQVPRDGSTQSDIVILVRDANGSPKNGQRLTVGASTGSLSAGQVTSGPDGKATLTFTAPPPQALGNTAVIQATPVGVTGELLIPRSISIALLGPSNTTAPVASFTVTPTSPEVNQSTRFDASGSTDEGFACMDGCSYEWDFGDGSDASGRIVNHAFSAAGTYTVTLTVTDAAGASATRTQNVTVANVAAPVVSMSVAPSPPIPGQQATFSANATAATGHVITEYVWNFGDGTSQTTTVPTVNHTFASQGTFVATVTVRDDIGKTASASLQLNITSGAISATIVVSPTNPLANQRVFFTAVNPIVPTGATIVSYEWNFGDTAIAGGGTATGQSVEHVYTIGSSRIYVVRLTITDSQGHVGNFTATVTVQ